MRCRSAARWTPWALVGNLPVGNEESAAGLEARLIGLALSSTIDAARDLWRTSRMID
jgi:hypothetical protein